MVSTGVLMMLFYLCSGTAGVGEGERKTCRRVVQEEGNEDSIGLYVVAHVIVNLD